MGRDAAALRSFYGTLFDWNPDTANLMGYGVVDRQSNLNAEGIGIGGGIGQTPGDGPGYVTFYVEVPDVEASLRQAVALGGQRLMGPETPMEGLELGLFSGTEGNIIGLVKA